MRVITLILIASSSVVNADIDYSGQMSINVQNGILNVSGSPAVAHCPTPHIKFLGCGSGSFRNDFGDCEVFENNSPIEIDYEVDNVISCEGINGTSEWRGPLQPLSGGSGTFSKSIPSGIDETTLFGIECQVDNTFAYTGEAKYLNVSNIHITPGYRGMIRWVGNQLHVVKYDPSKINHNVKHNKTYMAEGHRPYLVLSDEKPIVQDGQLVSFQSLVDNGRCNALGENIQGTQINIAEDDLLPDTCVLEPNKQYYLLQILFETK